MDDLPQELCTLPTEHYLPGRVQENRTAGCIERQHSLAQALGNDASEFELAAQPVLRRYQIL
jgi:hypothetical protein